MNGKLIGKRNLDKECKIGGKNLVGEENENSSASAKKKRRKCEE